MGHDRERDHSPGGDGRDGNVHGVAADGQGAATKRGIGGLQSLPGACRPSPDQTEQRHARAVAVARINRAAPAAAHKEDSKVTAKVFCIGFHKTGTTSLAEALQVLGYRVTGPNGVRDPDIATKVRPMAWELVEKYDAFQDNPWPILYRELDQRYPGSKFVLTVRETGSWMRSQLKHFGQRETAMRKWIYGDTHGCPEGNEEVYVRRYEAHNREVLEYFRDRPGDLLVMELAKGDGWNKLAPFLGKPIPSVPFPHANKAGDRALVAKLLKKGKAQLAHMGVHIA